MTVRFTGKKGGKKEKEKKGGKRLVEGTGCLGMYPEYYKMEGRLGMAVVCTGLGLVNIIKKAEMATTDGAVYSWMENKETARTPRALKTLEMAAPRTILGGALDSSSLAGCLAGSLRMVDASH